MRNQSPTEKQPACPLSLPHYHPHPFTPPTLHFHPTPPKAPMQAIAGLKSFGHMCPFLGSASLSSLRQLSTQQIGGVNGLTAMAARGCPLMAMQLRAKGFATSAVAPAPTATTPAAAAPATTTGSSAAGPASASASAGEGKRSYATVADALTKEQLDQAAEGAKSVEHKLAAAIERDALDNEFLGGRPTTALGFAKHKITSARPGAFDYEHFYDEQLALKHKDKSYRVSRPASFALSRYPACSSRPPRLAGARALPYERRHDERQTQGSGTLTSRNDFALRSTSTTSTAWLSGSRSRTRPTPTRRLTCGARTTTSAWAAHRS